MCVLLQDPASHIQEAIMPDQQPHDLRGHRAHPFALRPFQRGARSHAQDSELRGRTVRGTSANHGADKLQQHSDSQPAFYSRAYVDRLTQTIQGLHEDIAQQHQVILILHC